MQPSKAKEQVIGELNNSIKRCLGLEISSLGNVDSNQGTIFFTKPSSSSMEPFEFDCLSSGEKEVIDLLLDSFLRAKEYKDSIFLFDEPELHINTSIQRKLLKEIDHLVGNNGQIWIATHSIGFLRALQDDFSICTQVIRFTRNLKLASEVVKLKPMNKVRGDWLEIFETALDDLTKLVAPKRIIYCEGGDKPDSAGNERGVDAKVFNNIFNTEFPDTLFISSGGNTELEQRRAVAFQVLNKAIPELEIWVFKDRDVGSGKEICEKDRAILLVNQENYIRIMKRFEIENYLFDKEVLKAYCLSNNLEFNEAKYDELMKDKNIDNNDVKSLGSELVKYCNIKSNVSQNVFKENLSKCIKSDMNVYKELKNCIFDRQ